jgi:predicted HicB family RNase H-like nuclease
MMLTMQEFMDLIDYKITEGGDYTYAPFGPYAYQLSHWNEKHDYGGYGFSIVFDTKSHQVYSVETHDYTNNRSYRMIDQKHQTEDNKEAWDSVNFVDLDDVNDFLEKACAIKSGKPYDTRVTIPVNMTDEEFMKYARCAHEQDITLNQFVERAVKAALDKVDIHKNDY